MRLLTSRQGIQTTVYDLFGIPFNALLLSKFFTVFDAFFIIQNMLLADGNKYLWHTQHHQSTSCMFNVRKRKAEVNDRFGRGK